MKTNSWTTTGQAKDISSSHWLKFYEEAVIESEARTAVEKQSNQLPLLQIGDHSGRRIHLLHQ